MESVLCGRAKLSCIVQAHRVSQVLALLGEHVVSLVNRRIPMRMVRFCRSTRPDG